MLSLSHYKLIGLVTCQCLMGDCGSISRILVLWRRSIAPWLKKVPLLGPAMDWYWPSPTREPHLSSQDGIGGTIDYLARNITAGLVLPFIAYAFGLIFFRSVPNHTKRILLVRQSLCCADAVSLICCFLHPGWNYVLLFQDTCQGVFEATGVPEAGLEESPQHHRLMSCTHLCIVTTYTYCCAS